MDKLKKKKKNLVVEERHFLFFNVVDQVNKDDHRS